MTLKVEKVDADAPVECLGCEGHHRPSSSAECFHWDHNFMHVDFLTDEERTRLPDNAIVHNADGEAMITDRDGYIAVHGSADVDDGSDLANVMARRFIDGPVV